LKKAKKSLSLRLIAISTVRIKNSSEKAMQKKLDRIMAILNMAIYAKKQSFKKYKTYKVKR